jgi:hypothetical protein
MNKTLWVLTQKQTSKGFMTSRGYRTDGKPRFTKIMSLGLRFDTEDEAIEKRNDFLKSIDEDIKQHTEYITKAKQSLTKVYKTIGEFDGEARAFGGYSYNHMSGLNGWTEECDKIRAETAKDVVDRNTKSLEQYKKEKDYIINHIYIKEVPIGMRFMSQYKKTHEYVMNEHNLSCTRCGGQIPNIKYLKVGWGQYTLCACCMKEEIDEMQKIVDETPAEIIDAWSKERFILDLG